MTPAPDVTRLPCSGERTVWFSPENPCGLPGAGGTANAGRKGRPCIALPAGASATLAALPASDSGTVRRVWLTLSDRSPEVLRCLRLEAWWDGATHPAICAPLGDFFGQMCGQITAFESVFFGSPEARSFVCTLPMPFRAGCRLLLTNSSARDVAFLYYDIGVTVGDTNPEDVGYLHAVARAESSTEIQRDYEILPPVAGRGRFLGAHIGVQVDDERYGKTWWGEGEVKIYVDGDTEHPSLCGTGTEDYLGTAWGQGRFAGLYAGAPLENDVLRTYGFYRWHVPDPVWFHESVCVTVQQIGHCFGDGRRWLHDRAVATGDAPFAAGAGRVIADLSDPVWENGVLFERQDAWSSVAFFLLGVPNGTRAGNNAL